MISFFSDRVRPESLAIASACCSSGGTANRRGYRDTLASGIPSCAPRVRRYLGHRRPHRHLDLAGQPLVRGRATSSGPSPLTSWSPPALCSIRRRARPEPARPSATVAEGHARMLPRTRTPTAQHWHPTSATSWLTVHPALTGCRKRRPGNPVHPYRLPPHRPPVTLPSICATPPSRER